jgi:hypothetical protein
MGWLSLVVSGIVIGILYHMARLTDLPQLALWLSSTLVLIASLIALMIAPYTVNRGAAVVASVVKAVKQKRETPIGEAPLVEDAIAQTRKHASDHSFSPCCYRNSSFNPWSYCSKRCLIWAEFGSLLPSRTSLTNETST